MIAWLAALLGAVVFLALSVAIGVLSLFRVDADVAVLREAVTESGPGRCDREIEVGVGPVLLGLARAGLRFAEVEPEVRSALRAVRGASVGVYRLDHAVGRGERRGLLDRVDEAMSRRDWERTLVVMEDDNVVLAYTPSRPASPRDVRFAVMVLEGGELVIASVRTDPKPVLEMLLREIREARGDRENGLALER